MKMIKIFVRLWNFIWLFPIVVFWNTICLLAIIGYGINGARKILRDLTNEIGEVR